MPKGIFKHKKLSKEHKLKIGKSLIGKTAREKHYRWSNKPSYLALHKRIYKLLGKANHCEMCGLKEIPKEKNRYFEWSMNKNKDIFNLSNYRQLCIKCHRNFDGCSLQARLKMSKKRRGKLNPNYRNGKYINHKLYNMSFDKIFELANSLTVFDNLLSYRQVKESRKILQEIKKECQVLRLKVMTDYKESKKK